MPISTRSLFTLFFVVTALACHTLQKTSPETPLKPPKETGQTNHHEVLPGVPWDDQKHANMTVKVIENDEIAQEKLDYDPGKLVVIYDKNKMGFNQQGLDSIENLVTYLSRHPDAVAWIRGQRGSEWGLELEEMLLSKGVNANQTLWEKEKLGAQAENYVFTFTIQKNLSSTSSSSSAGATSTSNTSAGAR